VSEPLALLSWPQLFLVSSTGHGYLRIKASKAKVQEVVLTPSKRALGLQATERSMLAAPSGLGMGQEDKKESIRCA